jgi:hypothetical protein
MLAEMTMYGKDVLLEEQTRDEPSPTFRAQSLTLEARLRPGVESRPNTTTTRQHIRRCRQRWTSIQPYQGKIAHMAKVSASHKVRNGDVGFAQSARRMSASHKVRGIHNNVSFAQSARHAQQHNDGGREVQGKGSQQESPELAQPPPNNTDKVGIRNQMVFAARPGGPRNWDELRTGNQRSCCSCWRYSWRAWFRPQGPNHEESL